VTTRFSVDRPEPAVQLPKQAPILVLCPVCGWRAEHAACATADLELEAIDFMQRQLLIHQHERHRT